MSCGSSLQCHGLVVAFPEHTHFLFVAVCALCEHRQPQLFISKLNAKLEKNTKHHITQQGPNTTIPYTMEATINRGSYMSAHVLLHLLNELGKSDKMRGLPSILSLFCNEFNKFNKTGARMLDSIYHMILKLL